MSRFSIDLDFLSREQTRAIIDQTIVPYIDIVRPQADDDDWHVILDDRFGVDCTEEELHRWLPFVANAMAVAAGRSSHGPNSFPINRHGEPIAGYVREPIVGDVITEEENA
jgi:hypothetical protein